MAVEGAYVLSPPSLPSPPEPNRDHKSTGFSSSSSRHASSAQFSNGSGSFFASPTEAMFISRFSSDRDSNSQSDQRSSLDPRRLTSELDNSLIQQIHSLRLELDSKLLMIDSLEDSLSRTKSENEQLSEDLSLQAAESRSLRKQMQLLEDGTLSALGDMANDRDSAVTGLADAKTRLDVAKHKIREQDETIEMANKMRSEEGKLWENERRQLEKKAHIAEGRLKTMVTELAILESAHAQKAGGNDGTTGRASSRSESRVALRNSRQVAGGGECSEPRGQSQLDTMLATADTISTQPSLADELGADDLDSGNELSPPPSPATLPEEQEPRRRPGYTEDSKARKMMGLPFEEQSRQFKQAPLYAGNKSMPKEHNYTRSHFNHCSTKDSAFSLPASSINSMYLPMQRPSSIGSTISMEQPGETSANQRRKRITIPPLFLEQADEPRGTNIISNSSRSSSMMGIMARQAAKMTDSSVQTELPEAHLNVPLLLEVSTQTELTGDLINRPSTPPPLSITGVPYISIHPPASRPNSARKSVMLPPRTKNAACQVDILETVDMRSTSVQTEISPLRPISSRPTSIPILPPLDFVDSLHNSVRTLRYSSSSSNRPCSLPPRASTISSHERHNFHLSDGQNDNGPVNDKEGAVPRRPVRSNSMFAGFSDQDDKEDDAVRQLLVDHNDGETIKDAAVRKTLFKVKDSWAFVSQNQIPPESRTSLMESELAVRAGRAIAGHIIHAAESQAQADRKPGQRLALSKAHMIPATSRLNRSHSGDSRTGSIGSVKGVRSRPRSPSEPTISENGDAMIYPPFPVPTRGSSWNSQNKSSDGDGSPSLTSESSNHALSALLSHQPHEYRILPQKISSPVQQRVVRKARSVNVADSQLTQPRGPRPGVSSGINALRSTSASAFRPSTPVQQPLMRRHDQSPPSHAQQAGHHDERDVGSGSVQETKRQGVGSGSEQTSVVDAIAQTMVGEWMWKYVRKRTSFSPGDHDADHGKGNGSASEGGVRHQRWVWLAPYESAIMWSSKQPRSGPALMGKGGRKLTIQSVLDVRDDARLPKGYNQIDATFNRSILVLTAERALKFTAVSRDRHYIWLTALSFLSASAKNAIDLHGLPLPSEVLTSANKGVAGLQRELKLSNQSLRRDRSGAWLDLTTASRGGAPLHSSSSIPASATELKTASLTRTRTQGGFYDDAADAPQVFRTSAQAHVRKRSSTGPRSLMSAIAAASSLEVHKQAGTQRPEPVSITDEGEDEPGRPPSYPPSSLVFRGPDMTVTGVPPPTARERYESPASFAQIHASAHTTSGRAVSSSGGSAGGRCVATVPGRYEMGAGAGGSMKAGYGSLPLRAKGVSEGRSASAGAITSRCRDEVENKSVAEGVGGAAAGTVRMQAFIAEDEGGVDGTRGHRTSRAFQSTPLSHSQAKARADCDGTGEAALTNMWTDMKTWAEDRGGMSKTKAEGKLRMQGKAEDPFRGF